MTLIPDDTTFQELVIECLDNIDRRLDGVEREIREADIRFEAFQKGSESVQNMTKTIIITAGAAVIFAPLLCELAPTIAALFRNGAPT